MHLQFCLVRTRMTLIIRIFTDIFCICANQCHPFDPCSIPFFFLTDDVCLSSIYTSLSLFYTKTNSNISRLVSHEIKKVYIV